MTTGGGWQDQVGGLLPGVKLTRTAPGMMQVPVVQPLTLSPQRLQELDERMVLFYTGLPRLAKNVLKRVVDHFLARDAGTLEVLLRMRALAEELAPALEAGDWEQVGRAVDESWELNKRLEPTASNPDIERLFQAARPFIHGAKLAGAGGGGFMFALARSREDAERLSETLLRLQPAGRIVDAHLAQQGLTV